MSSEALPIPSDDELYEEIAARVATADAERVRGVLSARGIHLTSPLPARRQLIVHRLYCEGNKTGTDDNDGAFTVDMTMGPGPWAIASTLNNAGKSSILWALSYALRGDGFDDFRRPETVGWFTYVRADIEVAGVAVSIRLTFEKPGRPSCRLLSGDTVEHVIALDSRQETGPGVRIAAAAEPGGVKNLIDRFMLDRLGLRPLSLWAAEPGAPKDADGNRDSAEQVHGWASYFYAIALNSGNSTVLLGPTAYNQLPVKLMQLFLDVPYASELNQIKTVRKKENQENNRTQRRAREDAQAREQQIEPLRQALEAAKERVSTLETGQPDLANLLSAVDVVSHKLAHEQATLQEAEENHALARKSRLKDERTLRQNQQSSAARLLLGALDPESCPRCDHAIDDNRRSAEEKEHRCSVCANPLPEVPDDPDARVALISRLEERVRASRAAETTARQAAEAAANKRDISSIAYDQANTVLATARSSAWYSIFESAKEEVHQLHGALAVAMGNALGLPGVVSDYVTATTNQPEIEEDTDDSDAVLDAADEVLSQVVSDHSNVLFSELNSEIVSTARALGVANLSSVDLRLNGNLNARKTGAKHPFKSFSPTDRLRVRIAAVVGMIKIGRKRGIMSHPGLLLIDAPTAEELSRENARQAIKTLYETAANDLGIQIIITSIDDAVWEFFPENRTVTGPDKLQLF
ncbi:ATP-binding protein [Nocardiopsis sp. NRRL B-16309]|uniref:ATP-binding protein n=1 Tax=Nocardiopsis sp. NRRL B-16309 TaxID=1519494 RepID=UPI000B2948AD|nr:ATP-binding protein [Nocardiopsis sp. NRRL B-16309]